MKEENNNPEEAARILMETGQEILDQIGIPTEEEKKERKELIELIKKKSECYEIFNNILKNGAATEEEISKLKEYIKEGVITEEEIDKNLGPSD